MKCEKPFIKHPGGARNLADREARIDGLPLPCGRCKSCRINKKREWKHRLLLEQTQHEKSAFVTLTYDDLFIPKGGNLEPKDLTNFWKRLRKAIYPRKIRYFIVGEYGSKNWRPHYHAAIFGICYTEREVIEKAWIYTATGDSLGFVHTGDLTKHSADYMCDYVIKNMYWQNPLLNGLRPEFTRSSNRPGIGAKAINEIGKDILESNHFKGHRVRTLRYKTGERSLGRYLQGKLDESCKVPKQIIDRDIQDLADRNSLRSVSYDGNHVIGQIIADDEKRKIRDKKHKIFKKRKKL